MKQLDLKQRSFRATEITYLDRKTIQMDRMLLKLFELLRFDGRPAVRRRQRAVDLDMLVALMVRQPQRFVGFDSRPDVARAWLSGDLIEIMNRDRPDRSMVVGPRPFHLNAFKLANPKASADYGASQQIWAMLYYADPTILTRLKEFFGRGVDPAVDRYDGRTELDLETLAVLGLVDENPVTPGSTPAPAPQRPICLAEGRLLAEDLRALLSYEGIVPRHILARYIRTVLALHLGLFILRLLQLLPHRVQYAQRAQAAAICPLEQEGELQVSACPYQAEIVVDLTENPSSPTAALARASAAALIGDVTPYVRAVIAVNRLKDFVELQVSMGRLPPPRGLDDLLAVLGDSPSAMEGFYQARISAVLSNSAEEAEDPIVLQILRLDGLSSFEKYVELVCLKRLKLERGNMTKLIDSLTQKNRPNGFLRQPSGVRAPRRFVLGNELLETLAQIAVLSQSPDGAFKSTNVLIDDFVAWLRRRYGFVVYAPAHRAVLPEDQDAWRQNQRALRERLRQIGFFTDLSDAFNSQTLRPRYLVGTNA